MIPNGVLDLCFNYLPLMIPKYLSKFERIGLSLIPDFLVLGDGGFEEDKGDKFLKFLVFVG